MLSTQTNQLGLDRIQHRLHAIIGEDHIAGWDMENVTWPGLTVLLASAMYTLATASVNHWNSAEFRFSGELVGAGGGFLAVVMLASTQSKLKEWEGIARACEVLPVNVQRQATKLASLQKYTGIVQLLATVVAIVLAFAHVQVEHQPATDLPIYPSVMFLLGNMLFVCCIRQNCLNRLRTAKRQLITVDGALSEYTRAQQKEAEAAARETAMPTGGPPQVPPMPGNTPLPSPPADRRRKP